MINIINFDFATDPISEMRLLKAQAEVWMSPCYGSIDHLANDIRSALIQLDETLVVRDWRTIALANIVSNSIYVVDVFFLASRIN